MLCRLPNIGRFLFNLSVSVSKKKGGTGHGHALEVVSGQARGLGDGNDRTYTNARELNEFPNFVKIFSPQYLS